MIARFNLPKPPRYLKVSLSAIYQRRADNDRETNVNASPRGTLWVVLGRSGTLWDALERSGTLWDALGRSGTLWDALGLFWDVLRRSRTLWDALGRDQSILGVRFVLL
jgi:hypothetical protein